MPYQGVPSQHKAERFLHSSLSCSTCAHTSNRRFFAARVVVSPCSFRPYSADTTSANSVPPGKFLLLPVTAHFPARAFDPQPSLANDGFREGQCTAEVLPGFNH